MPDHADIMQPWTIRSFPTETRDTITTAARVEGVTVGQWLDRRVREWVADGSPMPVGTPSETPSDTKLESLVRMAVAISTVPSERVNDPMLRSARVEVRRALLAHRHTAITTPSDSRRPPAKASQPRIRHPT